MAALRERADDWLGRRLHADPERRFTDHDCRHILNKLTIEEHANDSGRTPYHGFVIGKAIVPNSESGADEFMLVLGFETLDEDTCDDRQTSRRFYAHFRVSVGMDKLVIVQQERTRIIMDTGFEYLSVQIITAREAWDEIPAGEAIMFFTHEKYDTAMVDYDPIIRAVEAQREAAAAFRRFAHYTAFDNGFGDLEHPANVNVVPAVLDPAIAPFLMDISTLPPP